MIRRFFSWILIVSASLTGYILTITDNVKSLVNSYVEKSEEFTQIKKIETKSYPSPQNDSSRRAGGAEMAKIFTLSATGSTSVAGILITPHTEKLNRATNLPTENLWPSYVILDEPTDDNGSGELL